MRSLAWEKCRYDMYKVIYMRYAGVYMINKRAVKNESVYLSFNCRFWGDYLNIKLRYWRDVNKFN